MAWAFVSLCPSFDRTRYVSTCFVAYFPYSAMSVSNWYTAQVVSMFILYDQK